MKKIGSFIIGAVLVVNLTACSGNKPEDTVQNLGSQSTQKELETTIKPSPLPEKGTLDIKFSDNEIEMDGYISKSYWSTGNNYLIFGGTKRNAGTEAGIVVLADTSKKSMKLLQEGYMSGEPSWSKDEKFVVLTIGEALYVYNLSEDRIIKVSECGYMAEISPDNKKIVYINDGIWLYNLEDGSNKQITHGKYDTAPTWFSDSTNIFYYRDNGKNLGDGAGNQQVMSVLDIGKPQNYKDVVATMKGKFRNASWMIEDELLYIYAGWDDGHKHYLLDLNQNKVIEIDTTEQYSISFDKIGKRILKARDGVVEIYNTKMEKIANVFINRDQQYPEAEINRGYEFIDNNRIVYLHTNQQEDKGTVMISYINDTKKQTRVTEYGKFSIPCVSDDLKRIAVFEAAVGLRILEIDEFAEEAVDTLPATNKALNEFLQLFPEKIGIEWIYNGFVEYGHKMRLDGINRQEDGAVQYLISGKVDDMSDGEAKGDFNLYLEYTFSNEAIKEKIIKGEKLPHRIKEFDIIRAPLIKGNTWKQTVEINGKQTELTAEIIEDSIEKETNGRIVKVQYTAPLDGMPDGLYKETRTFKERTGLQHFVNTFEKDIEFNYGLYIIQ